MGAEVEDLIGLTALVEAAGVEATGVVSDTSEGRVTVSSDHTWPTGGLADANISIFAPAALYRWTGPVTTSGADVRTGPGMSFQRIQRRKWPRRPMDLQVTLCPVADGRRVEGIPGRTVDVGIGGVCVETLRPVHGEHEPMVILSLPDGTSIVAGATTVEVEDLGDGWRYRLAFHDLDAHDAGRLAGLTA